MNTSIKGALTVGSPPAAWTNCCAGRRSGCPMMRLDTDGNAVRIRDDFGGEIRVSAAQFLAIVATGNEMVGEAIGAGLLSLDEEA